MARISRYSWVLIVCGLSFSTHAGDIPKELWGRWRINRILPTQTISCWGQERAVQLLGTEIEYGAHLLKWKTTQAAHADAEVREFTAEQFRTEYSSPSVSGSQVSFRELGIRATRVRRILIKHEPEDLTGGTIEIPGDEVFLKRKNVIVFAVCNVYFEASKLAP